MSIRAITTAALLLAFLPAHAQTGPQTGSQTGSQTGLVTQAMPSGNAFFNTSGNPHSPAPIPHQQQFSFNQFALMADLGRDAFHVPMHRVSTVIHASPSAPPMVIGSDNLRISAGPYVFTDGDPHDADLSEVVYYDEPEDAPPHIAPKILLLDAEPFSNTSLTGILPPDAYQPQAISVWNEAFKKNLARNSVWGMSSYEHEPAWSCIAINGVACPPSMQESFFSPRPARA